jgi:hypothetical protein
MTGLGQIGAIVAALVGALVPATRVETTQIDPPPVVSAVAPEWSRCPQWFTTALDAGFTAADWPTVDRVMRCESQCQPRAYNRSGASGLMQIMPMWHHGRDPFDPYTNLVMAKEVHDRQGWRAWSCY